MTTKNTKPVLQKKRNRSDFESEETPTQLPTCSSAEISDNNHNQLPKTHNCTPSSKILKRIDTTLDDELVVGKKVLLRIHGDSKQLYSARIYMKETYGVFIKLIGGKKIKFDDKEVDKFLAIWKGETSSEVPILDLVHEVL